jgi:hypothetical protein
MIRGMSSVLAWLDFSEEEQRRARELLKFFSERDTRDELGIGTVRDALSEAMFPGTSVIQTRARYFLFIPWLFEEAERRGITGSAMLDWVNRYERRLIEALRRGGWGGVGQGLIGRVAGTGVKTLPSAIYWTGLQRLGILRVSRTREQVAAIGRRADALEEALTELVERPDQLWDPNLPDPPDGFFQMDQASFELEPEEAEWLAERIEATTEGSLLEWLVASRSELAVGSTAPWENPATTQAPTAIQRVVEHAKCFSAVMHGAALVYNLLIAERAQEQGLDASGDLVDHYRDRVEEWRVSLDEMTAELAAWDRSEFWELVTTFNRRIPFPTRTFVDRWIEIALRRRHEVADDDQIGRLVANRERLLKGRQSRLSNDRLLHEWGGSSGAARLTFRWDQVKVLLEDIRHGRSADVGA